MTTTELQVRIGQTCVWHVASLDVQVKVLDARSEFGRVRLLVTPVAGFGQSWKDEEAMRNFTSCAAESESAP